MLVYYNLHEIHIINFSFTNAIDLLSYTIQQFLTVASAKSLYSP